MSSLRGVWVWVWARASSVAISVVGADGSLAPGLVRELARVGDVAIEGQHVVKLGAEAEREGCECSQVEEKAGCLRSGLARPSATAAAIAAAATASLSQHALAS